MSRRSVDLLLHYMPQVAREATDPWARRFAADMAKKVNWRNWEPSPKQRAIMDRLVNELFSHVEEFEVIE